MTKRITVEEWYDDRTDQLSAASGIGRCLLFVSLVTGAIWFFVAHS